MALGPFSSPVTDIGKSLGLIKGPDGPSIDKFISSFSKGFYRSNLYSISFVSYPSVLMDKGWTVDKLEKISLLCSSVEIPNITILEGKAAHDNKLYSVGIGRDYDSIGLKFMVDNNAMALKFIEDWINAVIDTENSLLNYKQDYEGDILINALGIDGSVTATYNIEGIFPLNKESISLSYSNDNQITEVSVRFSYDKYTYIINDGNEVESSTGGIGSYINKVAQGASAIGGAVGAVKSVNGAISIFKK